MAGACVRLGKWPRRTDTEDDVFAFEEHPPSSRMATKSRLTRFMGSPMSSEVVEIVDYAARLVKRHAVGYRYSTRHKESRWISP
jgi:hypothetical protein